LLSHFNNKTYKELTFKIKIMELKHFYIISTLLLIILFATIYFLHEQITASWTDTPSYTVEKQYEPVKLPTIHHEEDSAMKIRVHILTLSLYAKTKMKESFGEA